MAMRITVTYATYNPKTEAVLTVRHSSPFIVFPGAGGIEILHCGLARLGSMQREYEKEINLGKEDG